ncbi:MAG: alkaline phosphatase family protein [Gemmatimonadales bacterium]|nr:alkaline phosphatase family protein [Gemmatimonadales bacterium]
MPRPVLMLEFNELSPELMHRFITEGHLPNFKRLHDESLVYVTDAEEEQDVLEPWIQWVTVHTGLSYGEHGVFQLGDGPKCKKLRIWDILSREGFTNWICGSMNLRYEEPFNGVLLPDPWTVGAKPHPVHEFDAYLRFVTVQVQEHTNKSVPLSASDYIAFLRWMMAHGLSLSTITYIVRQLANERITGKFHWRRAIVLDRLQWDVFNWYFKRVKPDFSTFFLNSTAHFQHVHWRNMDPTPFAVKPTDKEQANYENAVLYGYQQMDDVVGRALALAGNTHTIVFSSALGQQPCVKYEESGGKVFYRPHNFRAFTSWAGLTMPHEIQPVMSEEFHVILESEDDAKAAEAQLATLMMNGRQVMRVRREGTDLMVGCGIFDRIDGEPTISAAGQPVAKFFELFYLADGLKSGMHHPDGILWIRNESRHHYVHPEKIPLRSVAPTLLAMFGVDARAWMPGEVLGGAPR